MPKKNMSKKASFTTTVQSNGGGAIPPLTFHNLRGVYLVFASRQMVKAFGVKILISHFHFLVKEKEKKKSAFRIGFFFRFLLRQT